MKTQNYLNYNIDVNNDKVNCIVKIRLSDPCKNGHNDFAIIGSFWEIGKFRSDKNSITAGACHDTILKYFPELKQFIDLHLSDVNGAPMYAITNGFYHLKQTGLNVAQSYIRANNEQFEIIKTASDEQHFKYLLSKTGLIQQWKYEANKAIEWLEEKTGVKFTDNSTKLQDAELNSSELAEIEVLINSGYYSPDQIEKRKQKEIKREAEKVLSELKEEAKKKLKQATIEYDTYKAILEAGISTKNFIFYNHTNTGVFNWKSFDALISDSDFNKALGLKLPEGVKIEIEHRQPNN